jgi:hypothetical protein
MEISNEPILEDDTSISEPLSMQRQRFLAAQIRDGELDNEEGTNGETFDASVEKVRNMSLCV